jgi:hypothetical protein
MRSIAGFIFGIVIALSASLPASAEQSQLKVRISWGHEAAEASPYYIRLNSGTNLEVRNQLGDSLEAGEGLKDGAWLSRAGGGDVDGLTFTLSYPPEPPARLENLHIIWADLIAHSDADTGLRLGRDAAFEPDSPRLTVFTNAESTKGFSVAVCQLLREKALWVPSLHIFLTAGDRPISFTEQLKQLEPWKGKRILEQVHREPEASYAQYRSLWEDMGDPAYTHPRQPQPGHIVCLTWDSAIPKFGVDRGAGVWNDYGNPDHFRFWFSFGDIAQGIIHTWKGQHLNDGLPIITTVFEKDGVRYEVEQFAYPLNGPPPERRGDISMVLMQKVRVTNLEAKVQTVPITMSQRRQFPHYADTAVISEKRGDAVLFRVNGSRRVLLALQGIEGEVAAGGVRDYQREETRINITFQVNLPANGTSEFVVKLPSPTVAADDAGTLEAIDYEAALKTTLNFWSAYVERGAQFSVPEKAVNDLVRVTLWHGLRLPRRHGGEGKDVRIDLPYSNFAYSQTGTPWPVNQGVYVDYMLYDLRGYHNVAVEELRAQYRNNQEYSGHVDGAANWAVYTPGMLYAVAKDYLLFGDRQALEELLPASLKALDYCLDEIRKASEGEGLGRGLVRGPLNDGTGEGIWAFNQAYMYAGLELFGQALERIGDPRAREAQEAASTIRQAIARGFGSAAARSPLVQLRDHTWIPYVPCEALTYGRLLDEWYPTDVDTGAVHLLRLDALPPDSALADSLLNDHEDNLFLHGWGMANEPVYNPQGTAYLFRDDPKAAIKTFYSGMACAFSHTVFEPVEHRWTHGQYFGPPSTDGSWFELFRNMLVREAAEDTLLLCQATPRKWLTNGQKIELGDVPTYYGKISLGIESQAASGKILAHLKLTDGRKPRTVLLRLRHPDEKPIRSVTVNGQDWTDFDSSKEWIRIPNPGGGEYSIVATY